MALPLGKIAILAGAGVLGSVLAKEGGMPSVSDFFSGAFKIAWNQLGHGDSPSPNVKHRNSSLADQVDSLRKELQNMTPNRSVIVMPTNSSGSSKVGMVVIIVVVGYGYVWWKGWKLPDLMFATRRSLSDACTTIAKQLEDVYSSLSATRRALSSKIESVDSKLDEFAILNISTGEEVSEIQGRTIEMGENVRAVLETVESLGTKIIKIEGKQNFTNEGVKKLCDYALQLEKENSTTFERIQASPAPRAALTSSSRSGSLPTPVLSLEPPSPSASDESQQDSQGLLKVIGNSNTLQRSNTNCVREETNNGTSSSSSSGFSNRLFRRTFSVTQGMISRLQSS